MVLGPGGSGVSMLAAAAALSGSHSPDRPGTLPIGEQRDTLLVTLDARSPVPALLGVYRVPGEPVPVTADVDLLHVEHLDVIEHAWTQFAAALTALTAGRTALPVVGTLASIAPGELTDLPGVAEFLMLRQVRDAATSGRWRRVVVDLSGVGDPFALLRAPTVLSAAIERMWPRATRLAQAGEKPVLAQLSAAVEGIDRDCQDLADLFCDPHSVAAHLVLDASERGRRVAADHLAVADLTALPLRSVLISAGESDRPTAATADTVRATLGDGSGVTVREIESGGVLDRLSRIRKIAVPMAAPSGRPYGSGALTVAKSSGQGVTAVFELRWRQGLPEPERLHLGRSGDDLLVTVAGFRHPVRLPSVLRRCRVVGADWSDGELCVRFEPDAAIWPARQGGSGGAASSQREAGN
ncbi:ArsA family ATPase [Gordonia sp. HY002]|uniref:ArsA family ATPase n=1 Tax=Gordonia zhenghanii TaxID=2911516 RepID=UPI001EF11703|nr:ArsA family ATPase [Gordonia zhenghanii]MCF8570801.1 ArsA family ATPase [Gordonia zhenghanii]MCF8603764.1 ArsA family ATPase [Gordonia zhenghanii]